MYVFDVVDELSGKDLASVLRITGQPMMLMYIELNSIHRYNQTLKLVRRTVQ